MLLQEVHPDEPLWQMTSISWHIRAARHFFVLQTRLNFIAQRLDFSTDLDPDRFEHLADAGSAGFSAKAAGKGYKHRLQKTFVALDSSMHLCTARLCSTQFQTCRAARLETKKLKAPDIENKHTVIQNPLLLSA